jgi:putative membrane protein
VTTDSLSQSMDTAVKHYSSLFKLPSYRNVILLLALTCVGGGFLSATVLFRSFEGLTIGLSLGFSLFVTNLIFDYVVSTWVLRRDPIYNLRRTTALSLFCWFLWLFFVFVGVALGVYFGLSWWVKLCLLGFSAVVILRAIAFDATSQANSRRLIAASLVQPLSCMIPFLVVWSEMNYPILPCLLYIVFSMIVSLGSSFSFIYLLNREGVQMLGVPSLSLLRAFLLNWVTDLTSPFEGFLEKLGEKQDVEVSLIKFNSSRSKAVMVVPSIHPGPFKNIGSSLLPSMLKTALEKELNCIACVPHGLFGHEFDLASQLQNQRIINGILESANFEASEARATRFVKVGNGLATACCQIFGDFAFVSFSLAPRTTEDLPLELGLFVRQEVEKLRLQSCVIVNAHNSMGETVNVQEALDELKIVAASSLEKAVSAERLPFEVGAATVVPEGFSLTDGMGPGGITLIVVKVGETKTAYVVIDGNNMVAGLREKVLLALSSVGIDDGEVFTTDTHAVNALILNERGYHPVGEAMSHEKLIECIKEATHVALSDLEPVHAACHSVTVPEVNVIGEKLLEKLCILIDGALRKAKRIVVPVFATGGLFLMLVLLLF